MSGNLSSIVRKPVCILLILTLALTMIPTSNVSNRMVNEEELKPQTPTPLQDTIQKNYSSSEEYARGWIDATGQMVINEFMLFPDENGAWIEIFNGADNPVSIDNWMISDEDGLTYEFSGLPEMPSGSYLVVHFDKGESETYFGESQPNALHLYTGWQNVRWTRHVVDSDVHYARVAIGYDIMDNGQPEILANRFGGNSILFYEPQMDITQEWILNQIAGTGGIHRLRPIDVDSDTHMDMVYDLYFGNEGGNDYSIHWMKAPATTPKDPWLGPYDIAKIRRPEGLDAGLINADNLADVVVGSKWTDQIYWFESPFDPTTAPWIQHDIDINFNQPGGLKLIDLDGDIDLDIVAIGSYGEEVVWYEHPVNPANPWTKHVIAPLAGPPSPPTCSEFDATGELYVGDLDDDMKLDVIVSEAQRDRIVWYRYDTVPTGAWMEYIIDDNISAPSGLDLGDIDNDGDRDLIASSVSGFITWYPHPPALQQYDPNWPRYIVDDSVHLIFYVNATDLDLDGDLDIVSADQADNRVLWFENDFLEFTAQDQVALYNATVSASENMVDFVAWGAPSLTEDDIAVAAGIWQDEAFIDMTFAGINQTIARDRYSTNNNATVDWNVQNGVDSDIPTMGTVNYPYPLNIDLKVQFNPIVFTGGSDAPGGDPPTSVPDGLCLANYSGFTFMVDVINPWGWFDLEQVELILDPGGIDIKLVWMRIDDNFSEFNPSDYIELIPQATNSSTDWVYRWVINFTIYFHWSYPLEGLQDASVTSKNAHDYNSTDIYTSRFQVVKTLTFVDFMIVRNLETGFLLGADSWISPGSLLKISGPIVIYDVPTERYYPGDSEFNVELSDNKGNSWVDYTSAGHPVSLTFNVPADVTTGQYSLTLTLVDIPNGAIGLIQLTFPLNADADLLQFDTPSPSSITWQTSSIVQCGITISDPQPGSDVAGYTIEYRVANGSVDRFGEWIPAPLPGLGEVMNPQVACNLPEGSDNWIQWRAKDVAGNGPSSSPVHRIPVDAQGVTYHEFYPPSTIVQKNNTVTVNITFADFGGSGVDIDTLQVAIRPSGGVLFSNWMELDYIIVNQTDPITDKVPSGPETVRISATIIGLKNGWDNFVKFRIRDIAGNNYTESEEYNIQIDIESTGPGDTVRDKGILDYWWLILLIIIILILLIITLFNKKRDSDEKTEQESLGESPPDDRNSDSSSMEPESEEMESKIKS